MISTKCGLVKGVSVILGVVYCPLATNYFSSLETVLETLVSEQIHHIIMGVPFNDAIINLYNIHAPY